MSKIVQVILFVALLALVSADSPYPATKHQVTSLPGWQGDLPSAQYTGYVLVNETIDAKLFYWFFESESSVEDDPVIIWFAGGPDCSSSMAAVHYLGPLLVNDDGTELRRNEWSWNQKANVIFVDQPAGVGFATKDRKFSDFDSTEEEVAEGIYRVLQAFFSDELFGSQFSNRPLYVIGESWAGKTTLVASARINKGNDNLQPGLVHLNLVGTAAGSGLSDPLHQYQAYPYFAFGNGLIDVSLFDKTVAMIPACVSAIEAGQFAQESAACNGMMELIMQAAGPINTYDISKTCPPGLPLCYNFTGVASYFNRDDVQKALGVNVEWKLCNMLGHMAMQHLWFESRANLVPDMLARNQSFTMFAGVFDFIVNFVGIENWVRSLEWPGQQALQQSVRQVWMVDGDIAGYVQNSRDYTAAGSGLLQSIAMKGGGHMLALDVPKQAFLMLENILNGVRNWVPAN